MERERDRRFVDAALPVRLVCLLFLNLLPSLSAYNSAHICTQQQEAAYCLKVLLYIGTTEAIAAEVSIRGVVVFAISIQSLLIRATINLLSLSLLLLLH